MATIALDIHGQGVAVQSYQDKVQQLTDVIVRHLARFRRIALRLLGNIADAEDAVQDAFPSSEVHRLTAIHKKRPRRSYGAPTD